MYTIGTSAVKYLEGKLRDEGFTVLADALVDRTIAYVGTDMERTGGTFGNQVVPKTTIFPASVFFVVPAVDAQNQLNMDPYAPVRLYIPTPGDIPSGWTLVGGSTGLIEREYFNTVIKPAGGFTNALYAFPRGDTTADMYASTLQIEGLPFFTKDSGLFVYYQGMWRPVSTGGADAVIGIISTWADSLPLPASGGYLRCDGTTRPTASYTLLYNVIGSAYGTAPAGEFRLPFISNAIIRYST